MFGSWRFLGAIAPETTSTKLWQFKVHSVKNLLQNTQVVSGTRPWKKAKRGAKSYCFSDWKRWRSFRRCCHALTTPRAHARAHCGRLTRCKGWYKQIQLRNHRIPRCRSSFWPNRTTRPSAATLLATALLRFIQTCPSSRTNFIASLHVLWYLPWPHPLLHSNPGSPVRHVSFLVFQWRRTQSSHPAPRFHPVIFRLVILNASLLGLLRFA